MSQQSGLSFTFKRNLTPAQYLSHTQGDLFNILYFQGCWSLTAKIEDMARKFGLPHENSIYLAKNLDFLEALYTLLISEKKLAEKALRTDGFCGISSIYSPSAYSNVIWNGVKNLEFLLHYLSDAVAASQLIEKVSDSCFDCTGSTRDDWISMCRAWGNDKSDNFEVIFWIK